MITCLTYEPKKLSKLAGDRCLRAWVVRLLVWDCFVRLGTNGRGCEECQVPWGKSFPEQGNSPPYIAHGASDLNDGGRVQQRPCLACWLRSENKASSDKWDNDWFGQHNEGMKQPCSTYEAVPSKGFGLMYYSKIHAKQMPAQATPEHKY